MEASVHDFEPSLRAILARGLPGLAGQRALAPRPRRGWKPEDAPPADCRQGGALVLCYPHDGAIHLVLTRRAQGMQNHAGQISLPGGAVEADETVEQGALREAEEEIGVFAAHVRVLGPLTPLHVPVSRFVVHPFVGYVDRRPRFRPDPREVAELLEVPLALLCDPDTCRVETWPSDRYGATEVPLFEVSGAPVWGATAMILAELLTLLGAPPDPWRQRGRA